MKLYNLLAIAFWFTCSCTSKSETRTSLTPQELKEDLQVLRKTLEEAHPGLYWYTSKQAMDKHFDSTNSLLTTDLSIEEFFKVLLPLIVQVRCVHTRLNPGTQSGIQFTRTLPFDLYHLDGKLYITKDYSSNGFEGRDIVAINNIQVTSIIDLALNTLPSDGYNVSFKQQLLNKGGIKECYALYYGQPDSFSVQLRSVSDEKLKPVKVKSIPTNDNRPVDQKKVELQFIDSVNTALLTINSFEISSPNFIDTISAVFKTIHKKKTAHLIIDIRKNGGGNNNNVPELISYFAFKPFLHLKRAEMNTGPFSYKKYFENQHDFENLKGTAIGNGKLLVNSRYVGTVYKKPAKDHHFDGDVFLLISGTTSSAASEAAAVISYLKRTTIIGQEAGGCYYGANGGKYIKLVLPNSKIQLRIPAIRILTAVDEDYTNQPAGRGTIPDVETKASIDDILKARDIELQMALKLIQRKD